MNAGSHVIQVTMENFQAEVVDKSRQVPVLLEFYADEAEPSRALAPVLQRLADSYGGKFLLARLNIRDNQPLVQQLGIRTLPTLKLISQGQIVQNLEGPQEEQQLRDLLDQLTSSPIERIREQIKLLIAEGDRAQAIALLQQVISEEPNNYALHTELCDLLIQEGREDEAQQILAALPKDAEGINKPRFRLEFLAQAGELPSITELEKALVAHENDLQLRLNLAIRQVVDNRMEAALENLLWILQTDREFGEDIARLTMIKVFELLGKGDALAMTYRRRMFALMH